MWIDLGTRYPIPDERVEVCYVPTWSCVCSNKKIVTIAVYEDGTIPLSKSKWIGFATNDLAESVCGERSESVGDYLIPRGWYEVLTSENSKYACKMSDDESEAVMCWKELAEVPIE